MLKFKGDHHNLIFPTRKNDKPVLVKPEDLSPELKKRMGIKNENKKNNRN